MADYTHLTNLIQGEVIRIQERRPLAQQEEALQAMLDFLGEQVISVTITKLKVTGALRPSEVESA